MIGGKTIRAESARLGSIPVWVVTFADLMTLLFCLFVLLSTLSTQPKNCDGIEKYLNQNQQHFKNYELRSSKLECVLSLPSDFLFRSGGDTIQEQALNTLEPLFTAIKKMDEHKKDLIMVEGHTDNVPIKTKKFPSNWELSAARATNIATFLISRIKYPSDMISVRTFADTRPRVEYRDIYGRTLTGSELRTARWINRRVEIILARQPESHKQTRLIFDGRE